MHGRIGEQLDKLTIILLALLFLASPAVAGTIFEACYMDVPLRAKAKAESQELTKVKKGDKVEAIKRSWHWALVKYNNFEGWVATTAMCQGKVENASFDLKVSNIAIKYIDSKWRHFFSIYNQGYADFTGVVRIKLYHNSLYFDGDSFKTQQAIVPYGGTWVYIDANQQMDNFEYKVMP